MQSEPSVVLIAERDPSMRELQRFFLDRAGYSVDFADDGVAALARAQCIHPALVVTEILIPKLDGLALCRSLKADPLTSDVPVMVFSVLTAAARAAEAGASRFIRKPFVESVFLAAVQDLAPRPPSALEKQCISTS